VPGPIPREAPALRYRAEPAMRKGKQRRREPRADGRASERSPAMPEVAGDGRTNAQMGHGLLGQNFQWRKYRLGNLSGAR
jgi:hypothetical protein